MDNQGEQGRFKVDIQGKQSTFQVPSISERSVEVRPLIANNGIARAIFCPKNEDQKCRC
jgi:hypothetical protein